MTQTLFAQYESSTGRIIFLLEMDAAGEQPHRDAVASEGQDIVQCPSGTDPLTHYVDNGSVVSRPVLSFDTTEIAPDDINTATLNGLPDPCTVYIDGTAYTIENGVLEFTTDQAGDYDIEILDEDSFPAQPLTTTIQAVGIVVFGNIAPEKPVVSGAVDMIRVFSTITPQQPSATGGANVDIGISDIVNAPVSSVAALASVESVVSGSATAQAPTVTGPIITEIRNVSGSVVAQASTIAGYIGLNERVSGDVTAQAATVSGSASVVVNMSGGYRGPVLNSTGDAVVSVSSSGGYRGPVLNTTGTANVT